MNRNKTLTVLQYYQNDNKLSSKQVELNPKIEESRIPKLHEVIDQWKLEVQANKTNLDQSILLPSHSVDEKDVDLLIFRSLLNI